MPSLLDKLRLSVRLSDEEQEANHRAVAAGYRLCLADGRPEPTLREVVWRLLREAVQTERSLPDRERSWLQKCVFWPEMSYTELERQVQAHNDYELRTLRDPDTLRFTDRLELKNVPRIKVRDRAAVDRYLVVMGWLRTVNGRSRRPDRDKDVVLMLAHGYAVKRVRQCYMADCGDKAVEMVRDKVLRLIVEYLEPCARKRLTSLGQIAQKYG